MKCKKIEKLLYLYRPGELTARDLQILDQHLKSCQACQRKKALLEQEPDLILLTRTTLPQNPSAPIVTAAVRRTVNHPGLHWSEAVLRILARPRVRLAMLGALALIFLSFFVQEFYILSRISRLENRMVSRSRENEMYFLSLKELKSYLDPALFNNTVDENLKIANDYIVISKRTLQTLIKAIEKREEFEKVLRQMEEWPDEINKKELDILWRQRKQIVKFYHHL